MRAARSQLIEMQIIDDYLIDLHFKFSLSLANSTVFVLFLQINLFKQVPLRGLDNGKTLSLSLKF